MNRAEFLSELRRCLAQMPPEELEKQIAYYDELLQDMIEDGMSEREAVEKLGEPAQIAQELLMELPLGTLVKSRVKSAGKLSALNVVLLVLGFPVWFPLLTAAAVILLALLISLWAVGLSLGAVVLAIGAAAAGVLVFGVLGYLAASPLAVVGISLIAGGLFIVGVLGLKPLFRGLAKLCKAIFKGVKSIFIKKEA